MSNIIKAGNGVLFMKVGTHAQETLDSIIERKTKEIEDAGFAMWGYGGGTCHPGTMVRPFAQAKATNGGIIKLVMQEMESHHFAEQVRADQFSVDGIEWRDIPSAINVLGSRYALVIKDLHKEEFKLPLARTRVALGPSEGRVGTRYIQGRVDKACLEIMEMPELANDEKNPEIDIDLVADLVDPYAVFLRNR